MQKLCCVRTRQHPLPVWSHNLSLTNLLISPSILNHFLVGIVSPVKQEDIRPCNKLIDMVWSMRRKRRINTQEIYKWKAQLNVHGGQKEYGIHYWETYAPVVTWQTLRGFMILSLIHGWAS